MTSVFDIQDKAIALIGLEHLDNEWNFSKMWSTSLYLKGLQNCSSSKLAHTLRRPEIEAGLCGTYHFVIPGLIPGRREVCANFDELQFWSPLRYRDVLYSFEKFQSISEWSLLVKAIAAIWIPEKPSSRWLVLQQSLYYGGISFLQSL